MVLLFDPLMYGHHVDYLRYALAGLSCEHKRSVVLVVGHGFSVRFPDVLNALPDGAAIEEIDADEMALLEQPANVWLTAYRHWKILKRRIDRYKPAKLLLMELTWMEWALCIFRLPCRVRTILFVQYPEIDRRTGNRVERLKKRMKVILKEWKTARLLKRSDIDRIFLPNGDPSCAYLNQRFHRTPVFSPLPDPVPPIAADPRYDVRATYRIRAEQSVFLFFGELSSRKGVDIVLAALKTLTAAQRSRMFVIVAGSCVAVRDAGRLHAMISKACDRYRDCLSISIRFVPDAELRAMQEQADCILMPYRRSEYSSGVLANAAAAGTPVIGPDNGLLGRLIRQYGLGLSCPVHPRALAECMARVAEQGASCDPAGMQAFVDQSDPSRFSKILWEGFLDT